MVPRLAVALLWTLSLAALFAAAVSDFRHRIIPNRLVELTAGCGVAVRLFKDPTLVGLSLGIAAVLMLVLGLAAHRGWLGGGDAKLIAAVTLLVPLGEITLLLLIIAVAGGVLSAIYLVMHRAARQPAFATVRGARPQSIPSRRAGTRLSDIIRVGESRSIPYGVAIFFGVAFVAVSEVARWLFAIS